jgi:sugar transferase (PEP-CTERM/EpsH1 system associated)
MKPTLLFISPRFLYPPVKGEKIRSWNFLRHFGTRYRVLLGCLVDDPADMAYYEVLRSFCDELVCFPINKRWQKIKSLATFRPGRPLMLNYNHHAGLAAWVKTVLTREHIDIAYIFSTPMAPYVLPFVSPTRRPVLVLDMVDIDSEKWREYALTARFPMNLVWAREARTLLAYEIEAARACDLTFLVSEPECAEFRRLMPEISAKLHAVEQGVDLDQFSPVHSFDTPYKSAGPHIALVGNMDYWPNEDAAMWFATEILPILRRTHPTAEFAVIGANPTPRIRALADLQGVMVTGRVADVRPYVAHAAAAVVPLRIARGIQNKVLEAMALGRPVVVTPQAFEGVRAEAGRDLLVADGAEAIAATIGEVLDGKHPTIGVAARRAMEAGYSWASRMALLDRLLDTKLSARRANMPIVPSKDAA